jgi:hypothetical protein
LALQFVAGRLYDTPDPAARDPSAPVDLAPLGDPRHDDAALGVVDGRRAREPSGVDITSAVEASRGPVRVEGSG